MAERTNESRMTDKVAREQRSGMPDGVGPKTVDLKRADGSSTGGKLWRSRDPDGVNAEDLRRMYKDKPGQKGLPETAGAVSAWEDIEDIRARTGAKRDNDDD
jgi:hypothetical protein